MNINANIVIKNESHLNSNDQTSDIKIESYKVSDMIVLTQGKNVISLSLGQIFQLRKAFEQIMD